MCIVGEMALDAAIVLSWWKVEKSQMIDDLPLFATCRFGTFTMLSSEVNSPVTWLID